MSTTLVQFQADEMALVKAIGICDRLGIDLPTYFRICMNRLIQENEIPFRMKLDKKSENRGLIAMKAASHIAITNGIADMTLDEINAEFSSARE